MGGLEWLGDRSDPRVTAALSRICEVCRAKPRQPCHNICGGEMIGRVVHLARLP